MTSPPAKCLWQVCKRQKNHPHQVVAYYPTKEDAQLTMRRLNATVPFSYDEPGYYYVHETPHILVQQDEDSLLPT